MAVEIPFFKVTGAGNDFVLVDNMNGWLLADKGVLARAMCDRHFGIGADGLLLLERAQRADFTMLYYNADGSFGGMCGNGGRCAALFAYRAGYAGSSFSFRALGHTYSGTIRNNRVALHTKDVKRIRGPFRIHLGERGEWEYHTLDTGSPHIVCFREDLEEIPVESVGRMLREHKTFRPGGTNVNFARVLRGGIVSMRTYERGVEAETLACGTGAIATALVSHLRFGLGSPVQIRTRSRRRLRIEFQETRGRYSNIVLSGEGIIIFHGKALYDGVSGKFYYNMIRSRRNLE